MNGPMSKVDFHCSVVNRVPLSFKFCCHCRLHDLIEKSSVATSDYIRTKHIFLRLCPKVEGRYIVSFIFLSFQTQFCCRHYRGVIHALLALHVASNLPSIWAVLLACFYLGWPGWGLLLIPPFNCFSVGADTYIEYLGRVKRLEVAGTEPGTAPTH